MLTYRQHYEMAKIKSGMPKPELDLYDFEYNLLEEGNGIITIDNVFHGAVKAAADFFSNAVEKKEHLWIPPNIDAQSFALRNKNIDNEPFSTLANLVIPQVEQNLFGCKVVLEGLYSYRNIFNVKNGRSSWLWHFDNNPKEIIKILIYLSDVDENNAPFQFLDKKGRAIKKTPTRIDKTCWSNHSSRILQNEIDDLSDSGFATKTLVGKRGTGIIFDNNIIHRATVPKKGHHRDVLCFMVRPTFLSSHDYVKIAGTWGDKAIFKNPETVDFKAKR